MRKSTQGGLIARRKTLESAIIDHEPNFYNLSCFKSHQVVEKALRALSWGVERPLFGLSLTDLLNKLSEYLDIPENIREYIVRLNKFYIPTTCLDTWFRVYPKSIIARERLERL